MFTLIDYLTADGKDPFKSWLADLADRQARARVVIRVQRMVSGNFGDCKVLTDGVCELRVDYGSGNRVYYARVAEQLLLLLVGGDKRTQQSDIETGIAYPRDWKRRACNE